MYIFTFKHIYKGITLVINIGENKTLSNHIPKIQNCIVSGLFRQSFFEPQAVLKYINVFNKLQEKKSVSKGINLL